VPWERVFYAGDGPLLPLCPAFDPARDGGPA